MSNYGSPPRPGNVDPNKANKDTIWIVSFGDLLTLLLCFFLLAISLSPLNPEAIKQANRVTTRNEEVKSQAHSVDTQIADSGTALAKLSLGNGDTALAEYRFTSGDFVSGQDKLTDSGQLRVKSIAIPAGYVMKRATAETCVDSGELELSAAEDLAFRQSLRLRSQLVDAGIEQLHLRLGSAAGGCDSAGSETVAAKVTLELQKLKNG